ncbi:MAG: DUF86 domain-containing protein [Candidatus Lokiarchaeota archaeon]|nr:DUF86 domain-containing protein [Candidatus Lokiarchaeota archaeon]
MEAERIKRYSDKIEYLNQTIENLCDWIDSIDSKEFVESINLQKQYGIYHAFQIGIEIITDLVAMMVKDLRTIPKDDYSNIKILENKKIISSNLAAKLREANGLRNRIVYDYNGLDNSIAYNRIKDLLNPLKEFKVNVKEWLKTNY